MKKQHLLSKIPLFVFMMIALFTIEGCQEKIVKISEVKKIKPSKLRAFFKTTPLPCTIDNLNILKITDSQEFNKNVIQQVFPLKWMQLFPDFSSLKHRIYPIRYFEKKDHWYLILGVYYPQFVKIYIAEFNEDNKMLALGYVNQIGKDKNNGLAQIIISKEPTFTSKVFNNTINKPNIKSYAFIEDSFVLILEEYAKIP